MQHQISELLIKETEYRLLEESLPRLKKCINMLSEDEIWYRPNINTVSIGNLVLHLCGNVRQWLVSGLGGAEDRRERQKEFDEKGPLPTLELMEMIDQLAADIEVVLKGLAPADLIAEKTIQGYPSTGVSILVHVVEHFSYHVGQATILVKSRKNMDMGYYAGKDLDEHNQ